MKCLQRTLPRRTLSSLMFGGRTLPTSALMGATLCWKCMTRPRRHGKVWHPGLVFCTGFWQFDHNINWYPLCSRRVYTEQSSPKHQHCSSQVALTCLSRSLCSLPPCLTNGYCILRAPWAGGGGGGGGAHTCGFCSSTRAPVSDRSSFCSTCRA